MFRNYHPQKGIISQNAEKINKKRNSSPTNPKLSVKNLGFHMENAIQNSISTLFLICGYMIISAVLINILENINFISFLSQKSPEILHPLFKGMIEVTSGMKSFSSVFLPKEIILPFCALILGLGGLSVLLQVTSIIAKTDLSIKPYILGKVVHGLISALYTYLTLKYTHFLDSDLIATFHIIQNSPAPIIWETSNVITVLSTLLLIAGFLYTFKRLKKTHT